MDSPSSTSERDPLERLAAEFLDRRRRGDAPSPSEYAELHPELAEQILEFFPVLEAMERLKPGSADRTASLNGRSGVDIGPRLERLGDFRILREIGHGGMGVVYEAVQESLGRRVALKILPWHGRIDPVHIERFLLESRSAARLHHAHIVPVYGMGEHEGVYYYAMQYIQGHGLDVILEDLRRLRDGAAAPAAAGAGRPDQTGSLAAARSLLTGRFTPAGPEPDPAGRTETLPGDIPLAQSEAREPAFDPGPGSVLSQPTDSRYYRMVARLGVQVAGALAHAHAQGVLHRDIKPSNLLLDAAGHVWVADFGLAKLEGSEGPTHTGDIVGTLRYMAPERFEGWSDRRSDIYGLGMTLYELLTLNPAFEAATRARLIDQVIHDPPASMRRYDARIPRDLETIVSKAIAKEPGERYATAEALAADLENYLADRSIMARRSSLPERFSRWCRRNPAAAGLLAASAVAALALVGVIVGLIDNARVRKSEHAAVIARRAEEDQRRNAEAAAEREEGLGYVHRIILAEREWAGNNMPSAEKLLDACPPHRRGWEWDYLKRLCHTEILSLRGHEGYVWDVAFSPDGRRVASAGGDRTVKVWDAESGSLIDTLGGHLGVVMRVAYSPDGRWLSAVSEAPGEAGRLVVYNARTFQVRYNLPTATGQGPSLAYSRDGRRLAVSVGREGGPSAVQIHDGDTFQVVRRIDVPDHKVLDLDFNPDGSRIAVACGSNEMFMTEPKRGELRVYDPMTGGVAFAFPTTPRPLITVAWSPDGRWIASGGWDEVVNIWDPKTRGQRYMLRGHRNAVYELAFSHDGSRLVSSANDASAKVWDPETGEELLTLRGHRSALNGVAYSPDGRRIATSSEDGSVKIWDATAGRESLPLRGHRSPATSVNFHPDGWRLVSAGIDRTVRVWDSRSGRMLFDLPGHTGPVWCAAFSPDGRTIASAGGDWSNPDSPGEVMLWDVVDRRRIRSWKAHRSVTWSVAFSPGGKTLAAVGGETGKGPGDILVWDLETGERIRIIPALPNGVQGVAFSPDGSCLATTGDDGHITLWDATTGGRLRSLASHKGRIYGVAFDRAGTRVVSASSDNTLTIWDLANDRMSHSLVGHAYRVLKGIFSPDGRRLVSASSDNTVKVWDTATGQELLTLRGQGGLVWSVAISPDGQRIASAHQDGIVRVWDAAPEGPSSVEGPSSPGRDGG